VRSCQHACIEPRCNVHSPLKVSIARSGHRALRWSHVFPYVSMSFPPFLIVKSRVIGARHPPPFFPFLDLPSPNDGKTLLPRDPFSNPSSDIVCTMRGSSRPASPCRFPPPDVISFFHAKLESLFFEFGDFPFTTSAGPFFGELPNVQQVDNIGDSLVFLFYFSRAWLGHPATHG